MGTAKSRTGGRVPGLRCPRIDLRTKQLLTDSCFPFLPLPMTVFRCESQHRYLGKKEFSQLGNILCLREFHTVAGPHGKIIRPELERSA
jgi:hypothetical protein